MIPQQRHRRHELSRRAETALDGVGFHEGTL
jgi:hypothetical protein